MNTRIILLGEHIFFWWIGKLFQKLWRSIYKDVITTPDDFVIVWAITQDSQADQYLTNHRTYHHLYPKKWCIALSIHQFFQELQKYFVFVRIDKAYTYAQHHRRPLQTDLPWRSHQYRWVSMIQTTSRDLHNTKTGIDVEINTLYTSDIRDIVHHIVDPKWPDVSELYKKLLFVTTRE